MRNNVLTHTIVCSVSERILEICEKSVITKLQAYHSLKYLNNFDLGLIYIFYIMKHYHPNSHAICP